MNEFPDVEPGFYWARVDHKDAPWEIVQRERDGDWVQCGSECALNWDWVNSSIEELGPRILPPV